MQRTALDKLCREIERCKLFERKRVPTELKARAILAYFRGMSFRDVAAQYDHAFSPESVRRWWRKAAELFNIARGKHSLIVADETSLHLGKRTRKVLVRRKRGRDRRHQVLREIRRLPATHILWVSIDPKSMEVVNILLGKYPTSVDCHEFLRETIARSRTRPHVVHDRGSWYRRQCELLELSHEQMRGGIRSSIECWNRQLKHRIDGFWRAFPVNGSNETMKTWLKSYCVCWNLTRPHRA